MSATSMTMHLINCRTTTNIACKKQLRNALGQLYESHLSPRSADLYDNRITGFLLESQKCVRYLKCLDYRRGESASAP